MTGQNFDSLEHHGGDSNRQASRQLVAKGVTGKEERLQVFAGRMFGGEIIHNVREHGPVADTGVGKHSTAPGRDVTHQGRRKMVATLKPIRTHINMKTGRLLGTQATITTAGMKSWERKEQL